MINLHQHSWYSCLDGLGSPENIVLKAKKQGVTFTAITDHASISCYPDFKKACDKHNINLILGCEFYIVENIAKNKGEKRHHLTVWAKNWNGVQSIIKQLSIANKQFYYRPRLSFEQILNFKDCFIGTACCFGLLAHDLHDSLYLSLLDKYKDDVYLEIMPHVVDIDGVDLQKISNNRAFELKKKYGGKFLLTNDAHYVNKEDSIVHRNLLCTQYRKKIDDFEGWGEEFYIKDLNQMAMAGTKVGFTQEIMMEGVKSARKLAGQVEIKKPSFQVALPAVHGCYKNDEKEFQSIIIKGWNEKIQGIVSDDKVKAYHDRLIFEISVIKKMDFVEYFVIVQDIVNFAKKNKILVGVGRGSSGGSLVCYLMGITQVDPIKFGLFFERFLNPNRLELPDIDVDFQDDRRREVFDYISSKYGQDKTAFINAFSSLSVKSAFRDICSSHGINHFVTNNLSKQIEDQDSFDIIADLVNFKNKNTEIVDISKKLDGVIRQTSIHPCGIVISNKPLNACCVLERRLTAGKEVFVSNWDKRQIENFGMLKVDILGLSTLTILNIAKELILKRTGKSIIFNNIPLDDKLTLKMLQDGDTTGIFQFEGHGMKDLLKAIKPKNFMEVALITALHRPGSLESGETDKYKKISQGKLKESYLTPMLEPILKETKGILVYQEQIMQIFHKLGNFTLAESDQMRKIIGKKLGTEEFEKHRNHFAQGCLKNNINNDVSEHLFDLMVKFSGYGFNKSHAVAYTIISWQCAYLKAHYPCEFLAAALCIVKDDKKVDIVLEAKSKGMGFKQPDINISTDKFELHGIDIIYPLSTIKGVGSVAVKTILNARENGEFKTLEDFESRIVKRSCNKRVINNLKMAGAFESLDIKEEDNEIRHKNFCNYISGYVDFPEIKLSSFDIKESVNFIENVIVPCAKKKDKKPVTPQILEKYLGVMVINNITVKQRSITGGTHGQKLSSLFIKNGIKTEWLYYTSYLKCKTKMKTCLNKCYEHIKQEIKLATPKLIICFSTDAVSLFEKNGKMKNLSGKIKYCEEYDCYVMFSYSPQYCLYKGGELEDKFNKNIENLAKVIKE